MSAKETELAQAAENNQLQTMERLIAEGVSADAKNGSGTPALVCAALALSAASPALLEAVFAEPLADCALAPAAVADPDALLADPLAADALFAAASLSVTSVTRIDWTRTVVALLLLRRRPNRAHTASDVNAVAPLAVVSENNPTNS